MGGGLIALIMHENIIQIANAVDNINFSDEKTLSFIENIDNFEYIIKSSNNILLNSCKRNKPAVAMKLLKIYENYNNDLFNLKSVFLKKDISNKTALNYAVLNNMKDVALKILELKKSTTN